MKNLRKKLYQVPFQTCPISLFKDFECLKPRPQTPPTNFYTFGKQIIFRIYEDSRTKE